MNKLWTETRLPAYASRSLISRATLEQSLQSVYPSITVAPYYQVHSLLTKHSSSSDRGDFFWSTPKWQFFASNDLDL